LLIKRPTTHYGQTHRRDDDQPAWIGKALNGDCISTENNTDQPAAVCKNADGTINQEIWYQHGKQHRPTCFDRSARKTTPTNRPSYAKMLMELSHEKNGGKWKTPSYCRTSQENHESNKVLWFIKGRLVPNEEGEWLLEIRKSRM
jgi:hypothetical protein